MKKSITLFLQLVIILIGACALTFMLWEPHLEGRNINATPFEIYFNDPFLAYVYVVSISFFVALYQVFRLLGYVRQDKVHSEASIRALRITKHCALALAAFTLLPVVYLLIVRPGDDIAGGVAVGTFVVFVSGLVAVLARVFERILEKGLNRYL